MEGIAAAVVALGGLLLLSAALRAGLTAGRRAAARMTGMVSAAGVGGRALGLRGLVAAAVGTATAGVAASTSAAAVTVAPAPAAHRPAAAPAHGPGVAADSDADRGADYVVRPGDSLWAIAAAHLGPGASDAAIAAEWPRWYRTNRAVIGSNPSLLLVGTRLHVPHGRRTGTSASPHLTPAPPGPDRTALTLDPDRR